MSKNLYLPSPSLVLGLSDSLKNDSAPCSNTGGNLSPRSKKTDLTAKAKVCIDYLTVSYPASAFDVPYPERTKDFQMPAFMGYELKEYSAEKARAEWLQNICKHVSTWMKLDCVEVLDLARGFLGFSNSAKIAIRKNDGDLEQVGVIAWGGHSQNGRVMLSLTGMGTALIENWLLLSEWIESTSARITRIDLAADFMDGQYTIEQALEDYEQGNFKAANGGGNPSGKLINDLGSNEGKTLYIGKRENGKMIRLYEKGKQLGDKFSKWVRAEGELHNKDRIIPVDILNNPESYWAGLNPVFGSLLDVASIQVRTAKKVLEATLSSLSHYAAVGYGKLINALMTITNDDEKAVITFLRRDGVPRRLRSPLVACGFLSQLEVVAHGHSLASSLQV